MVFAYPGSLIRLVWKDARVRGLLASFPGPLRASGLDPAPGFSFLANSSAGVETTSRKSFGLPPLCLSKPKDSSNMHFLETSIFTWINK